MYEFSQIGQGGVFFSLIFNVSLNALRFRIHVGRAVLRAVVRFGWITDQINQPVHIFNQKTGSDFGGVVVPQLVGQMRRTQTKQRVHVHFAFIRNVEQSGRRCEGRFLEGSSFKGPIPSDELGFQLTEGFSASPCQTRFYLL